MRPRSIRRAGPGLALLLLAGIGAGAAAPEEPPPEVRRFEVDCPDLGNGFRMNAYLVFWAASGRALLIDPGRVDLAIDGFLKSRRLRLVAILNTHGHGDHTGGDRHYAGEFGGRVYAPSADRFFFCPPQGAEPPGLVYFDSEPELRLAGFAVRLLPTPGHTYGSTCFLVGGQLFSGDTLFAGSVGKPAEGSPSSREENLDMEIAAIRSRLLTLPDSTPVFPGHGDPTTIGAERAGNGWLRSER